MRHPNSHCFICVERYVIIVHSLVNKRSLHTNSVKVWLPYGSQHYWNSFIRAGYTKEREIERYREKNKRKRTHGMTVKMVVWNYNALGCYVLRVTMTIIIFLLGWFSKASRNEQLRVRYVCFPHPNNQRFLYIIIIVMFVII
jgi:hypothetical protein